MMVYNEGSIPIYRSIGNPTVTAGASGNGIPIMPSDYEVFYFNESAVFNVPIYVIAVSANANVKVSEL
jgi:hypothetical protein